MTDPRHTQTPDPAARGFLFNHTMIRVKDPKASLTFYCDVLGMTLLSKLDFEQFSFTNYYLGYTTEAERGATPSTEVDRARQMFARQSVLELTHNWGTESDDDFDGYHNGNSDPKGFGHICIQVPNLDAAVEHFDAHDVVFTKRPNEGGLKGLAFIKDPDGYLIEVIDPKTVDGLAG